MAGRVGRNDRQREFVKEYDALCYHHNRHEVWQDFVWLIAASIANLVDRTHADKREERY